MKLLWFAAVGIILYRSVIAAKATIWWSRRSAVVAGTVVAKKRWAWSVFDRFPKLRLDVEFTDVSGTRHELKSTVGDRTDMWWGHWKVGSKVEVAYDPSDPNNSELTLGELPRSLKLSGGLLVMVHAGLLLIAVRELTK